MDFIIVGHLSIRTTEESKTATGVPLSVEIKVRRRFGRVWLNPGVQKHFSVLQRLFYDGLSGFSFLATNDWNHFATDANGTFQIGPIPDEVQGVRVFIHHNGRRERILDIPLNPIRTKNAGVLDQLSCSLEFAITYGDDTGPFASNDIDAFLKTHRPPGRMR